MENLTMEQTIDFLSGIILAKKNELNSYQLAFDALKQQFQPNLSDLYEKRAENETLKTDLQAKNAELSSTKAQLDAVKVVLADNNITIAEEIITK